MLSERSERVRDEPEADGSLRLCVVTRRELPPEELIRFAAAPDGTIVPDLACRLPGRGVWVGAHRDTVATAVKNKAFAKSLKRQVSAAPDLADLVDKLMLKRLAEAISIANKAGLVTTGFVKVEKLVDSGTAYALLHGHDGAEDGRHKLDRKLAAIQEARGRAVVIVDVLAIDELSLAIGRSNVVHAALKDGGAAKRVIREVARLTRYRSTAT